MKTYNIIGDIHGHAEELKKILNLLGYRENQNSFYHPNNHQAIFVGDLINRGPHSERVLDIVKNMHAYNQAKVVLGNHEFRLIQQYFINPASIDSELMKYVSWLKSLPLFLEMEDLRVVHAAWHFPSIDTLKNESLMDDQFIESTLEKNSEYKRAVRAILQGIKIPIPENIKYFDRFGINRKKARIKWWEGNKREYNGTNLLPSNKSLENTTFEASAEVQPIVYPKNDRPVFFGHYCLPPEEGKVHENLVCVDGCVTFSKELWAYQYDCKKIHAQSLISAKL